jgi:dolichol-phosphate mannosyltransferase
MNLGFKQATVSYVRERRHKGHSKWGSFPRLLKIGIDMIVGFSYFPLRLMLYAGLLTTLLTVVAAVVLLVKRVLFDAAIDGWGWLALIVLFSAGLNATMFGILGEYVWRVLDETRGRPLYVIQERVGFAADLPKEDIRGKLTVEGG